MKPFANTEVRSPAERHAAMTWAQRLKRVFNIDIEVCSRCGGSVRVIACIEDQDVIPDKAGQALDRILAHLRDKEQGTTTLPHLAPPSRAPPETLPSAQHEQMKKAIPEHQIAPLYVVGSNDTTAPIIDASFRRFLQAIEAHLQTQPFRLGNRPAAGDFALFG